MILGRSVENSTKNNNNKNHCVRIWYSLPFSPRKCATSLDATFSHTYTVYCNVHGSVAHGSTRRARHDLRHRQRSEEHKELHREHAQRHALFRSFPLTVSEWNLLPTPISTTLTLGPEEHKDCATEEEAQHHVIFHSFPPYSL